MRQYAHNVQDKKTDKWRTVIDYEQVLFTVNEIDTLAALWSRQGATLRGALRSMYMGEELGFGYADGLKRVILPEHSYRARLIIGVQPGHAETLLNDQETAGGTPGHVLWLPATDPAITADDREARPLRIEATRMRWSAGSIKVPEPIRREMREHLAARHQGGGNPLESHRMFTQLKITLPLALLEDRRTISREDWELAALVMAKSDSTLQSTLDTLARAKADHNRSLGYAAGEREDIKKNVLDRDAIQRVSRTLLRTLDRIPKDSWISRSALRRSSLSSDDRKYFEAAIAALIESGQAEERPVQDQHGGHQGTEYRKRN